jgi:hypothetical protein
LKNNDFLGPEMIYKNTEESVDPDLLTPEDRTLYFAAKRLDLFFRNDQFISKERWVSI